MKERKWVNKKEKETISIKTERKERETKNNTDKKTEKWERKYKKEWDKTWKEQERLKRIWITNWGKIAINIKRREIE